MDLNVSIIAIIGLSFFAGFACLHRAVSDGAVGGQELSGKETWLLDEGSRG